MILSSPLEVINTSHLMSGCRYSKRKHKRKKQVLSVALNYNLYVWFCVACLVFSHLVVAVGVVLLSFLSVSNRIRPVV